MSVDILIVTYRDKDKLQECVESIEKFADYPHGILVHDNSPPNPNLGFGKANNLLLLKSHADYVMLLNADTKVTRDWLSPLLKEMENHSVRTQVWDEWTTARIANKWVDTAINQKLWLIEVFHAMNLQHYPCSCSESPPQGAPFAHSLEVERN